MPSNGYTSKVRVLDRYKVVGFIRYVRVSAEDAPNNDAWVLIARAECSSGTYGRVYKAVGWNGQSGEFAIKK